MSTAIVRVIHDFIANDGKWRYASHVTIPLPAEEAKVLDSRGYVDILEVDGLPVVWASCCGKVHT